MGRSHQTIIRMRGPAILALMSLLLLNVGAQPLAGSYPKTLDCKGEVSVNQDDSGTTLTCGDGNTYPMEPCEDGINMNQVDGKTTVTCGGGASVEEHSWPVQEHGGWPVQEHGSWPVQEHGSWPVQEHGSWPMGENGSWGVDPHHHGPWWCRLLPFPASWICRRMSG